MHGTLVEHRVDLGGAGSLILVFKVIGNWSHQDPSEQVQDLLKCAGEQQMQPGEITSTKGDSVTVAVQISFWLDGV